MQSNFQHSEQHSAKYKTKFFHLKYEHKYSTLGINTEGYWGFAVHLGSSHWFDLTCR